MNFWNIIKGTNLCQVLLGAFIIMSATSCDDILDNGDGDCSIQYQAKFVDDYNMNYADAFNNEVKSVSLYAFDKDGKFVYQKTDAGSKLEDKNYLMDVDINPDQYNLVVWGGLEGNKAFSVPVLTPGVSTIDDLNCMMNSKTRSISNSGMNEVDEFLNPLFHAYVPAKDASSRAGFTRSSEIELMKVTHNFHIVLQQISGKELNSDDYTFVIYGKHSAMNYKDETLPSDGVKYSPWKQYSASANVIKDGEVSDAKNAVVAELSVGRLFKTNDPVLEIVNNKTGKTVLSVPIVDFALLLKNQRYENMADQEYLDRMYDFNIIFFLDNNYDWASSSIIINSWRVVLNNADLK